MNIKKSIKKSRKKSRKKSIKKSRKKLYSKSYSKIKNQDDILLNKQKKYFIKILKELIENNGQKKSHWAWWVFPTSKEGISEPDPKTRVINPSYILENANLKLWSKILDNIKNLPSIDIMRVKYFLEFWLETNRNTTQKFNDFYKSLYKFKKRIL
jgi:hypothetical protein